MFEERVIELNFMLFGRFCRLIHLPSYLSLPLRHLIFYKTICISFAFISTRIRIRSSTLLQASFQVFHFNYPSIKTSKWQEQLNLPAHRHRALKG